MGSDMVLGRHELLVAWFGPDHVGFVVVRPLNLWRRFLYLNVLLILVVFLFRALDGPRFAAVLDASGGS